MLLTRQGHDEDIEQDEVAYWGENNDIDESIASSGNDDDDNDDNDDDQNRISTNNIENKKFFKTATNVLKAVKLFKGGVNRGSFKENKVDTNTTTTTTNMNDDEIPASKHSPNEKIHKPTYLINVFDNINGDSATAKRLGIHIYANTTNTNTCNDTEDSKEEEDIKEKIREIKKYVDIGITAINY